MILVSIGANLPSADGTPPLETCRRAAVALDGLPGLRLRGLSRWYETTPILAPGEPAGSQPAYINGVAHLVAAPELELDPQVLLAQLMAAETSAGRKREVRNAPRVLDLDVVAMGKMVREAPDPIVPHPRAHQRAFVLVPLRDVASGWVHPILGQTVEALIARLPDQGVRAL